MECVELLYSMLGFGLSKWDWVECVGMLCRCLGIACSVWVVIYYAASLLFCYAFCCIIVLHDILGLYGLLTGCLCFLPYVGGRVLVFRLSSALVMLLMYVFCA